MNTGSILFADPDYYEVTYTPDVVFAHRETGDLLMQILTPCSPNLPRKREPSPYSEFAVASSHPMFQPEERRFPLVVAIAGSGWSGPDSHKMVPLLACLAQQGYVVACPAHRGTYRDDVRFPAAIQDTKEAIRFMRAHADEYCVDVDRVGIIGGSSGGHTVVMTALSDGEQEFEIGENLDQSSSVNACVAFYAPVDFQNLLADRRAEDKRVRPGEDKFPFEMYEMFKHDFEEDVDSYLERANVMRFIEKGKKYPALLYLVGDRDEIIPVAQGERLCQKLNDAGARADFVKIIGAGHGYRCWNSQSQDMVRRFFDATL